MPESVAYFRPAAKNRIDFCSIASMNKKPFSLFLTPRINDFIAAIKVFVKRNGWWMMVQKGLIFVGSRLCIL